MNVYIYSAMKERLLTIRHNVGNLIGCIMSLRWLMEESCNCEDKAETLESLQDIVDELTKEMEAIGGIAEECSSKSASHH